MNAVSPAARQNLSVAITGSGGSGAVTTGLILLKAAASTGFYGLMTRSAGPQIRGGESAAMLRFGPERVDCMDDRFDLLLGIDWLNVDRFVDEIPLGPDSLVVGNAAAGDVPEILAAGGARVRSFDFNALAAGVKGGRANMVALGILGSACGLPPAAMEAGVRSVLAEKGDAVVTSSLTCVMAGYDQDMVSVTVAPAPREERGNRWDISGNEACGLGALRGGIRFVAAYPITPASEMLEWMAPRLELLGGSLLQAEDELASVNMIIGASFGGVPSLTATSGPGLSLMVEGMGLAVASETPAVVVDVMRGGPSTGIPTKSEQSDLNLALYGFHGDAPHLVLAPVSIADGAFTTQWAVYLAEHLQTIAIVLSDQALGQSRSVTDEPREPANLLVRRTEHSPVDDYHRYAISDDGISAMTAPGTPGGMYTADGLEHNEKGTPSSMALDHELQMAKRLRKIESFDFGSDWAEIRGEGPLCIVTWGSVSGAVFEAVDRLAATGVDVRVLALRLLAPLRRDALGTALEGVGQLWVVEQNHSGQLYHYLQGAGVLPAGSRSVARPGPLPLRPGEVVDVILDDAGTGEDK